MTDNEEMRFSIDEIHLEEEIEEGKKNIYEYYNMFMNSLPRIHAEHPNPNLRPMNAENVAKNPYRPPNKMMQDMAGKAPPQVNKIAIANPYRNPMVKPNKPSLFMKKV